MEAYFERAKLPSPRLRLSRFGGKIPATSPLEI
jgi:hypothetical protein